MFDLPATDQMDPKAPNCTFVFFQFFLTAVNCISTPHALSGSTLFGFTEHCQSVNHLKSRIRFETVSACNKCCRSLCKRVRVRAPAFSPHSRQFLFALHSLLLNLTDLSSRHPFVVAAGIEQNMTKWNWEDNWIAYRTVSRIYKSWGTSACSKKK